jgi:hypothetical protein
MNCYDCQHNGQRTAAIAVCRDCGAALCPDHTTEATHHLTVTRALNRHIPVDPPERRILCHPRTVAITAAANMTVGAAATR